MIRKLLNELFGCSFFRVDLHIWSEWETVQDWSLLSNALKEIVKDPENAVDLAQEALEEDSGEIVQKRVCTSCQKIEIRRIPMGDCTHVWGKWKEYEQPMTSHSAHGDFKFVDKRQKRTCTKCGLSEDVNMDLR